jgi:hypothetical protein
LSALVGHEQAFLKFSILLYVALHITSQRKNKQLLYCNKNKMKNKILGAFASKFLEIMIWSSLQRNLTKNMLTLEKGSGGGGGCWKACE